MGISRYGVHVEHGKHLLNCDIKADSISNQYTFKFFIALELKQDW